ncbi:MAG: histidinol-phosphate transaminase [Syntrophomonadaceae bacterium]|jgi:histidinol-phosphate aminotransferase
MVADFVQRKARPEIFNLKPYVPGKPIDEVRRELGIDEIIKLASNENPLGASPKGVAAVREALADLHLYPDANCFNLKKKLAAALEVSQDGLIIGNGSDELLKLIAETFLSPGDTVIYPDPSFAEYEFTAKIMGAECKIVPLVDFKLDLDGILAAIDQKTKIVYICNPNNPTGTIVTADELERFMQKVPNDVLVIFDEAYYEYVASQDYISGLNYVKQGFNAIVLRTFSKIYGLAGLRVGYGITTPEIARAVERVTEPFNVNLLAQAAAVAALDDVEHVTQSKQVNLSGIKYLYEEFDKLGLKYVETQSNFIFADMGQDSQNIFQQLLAKGVIIRPGYIFGFPTFIRVTVGNERENQIFIKALKEVLES